jgi:hypothetical protein
MIYRYRLDPLINQVFTVMVGGHPHKDKIRQEMAKRRAAQWLEQVDQRFALDQSAAAAIAAETSTMSPGVYDFSISGDPSVPQRTAAAGRRYRQSVL